MKTYDGCGFTVPAGYTLRDRVWDTKKDGTGKNYANGGNYPFEQKNQNQTIHLYAQYNEPQPDPDSRYTITYYDGTEKVGEDTVVAGKSTTTMSALIKDGCTFLGWSTTPDGNVEYAANVTITPTSNMTLYAVWEENYTPNPSAPPSAPGADTLGNLLNGKIKVTCVTNDTAHGTKEFDLIAGSYTVGDVEGDAISGYTCDVSISPDKYVEAYNAELSLVHTTDDTAKIVTLKCNDDSAWVVDTGTPVEFKVQCETEQPTPPPSAIPGQPGADTLKDLLGKIKVTCVTSVTAHGTKGFDLIDGSYTVGDVKGDATSGYTCEVSISPDKYVEAYNAELSLVHTTDDTAKIVTLKCNDDSAWVVDRGTPVEFNVTCSDEDKTFTVTYLDGFGGTYATRPNLKYGDATPVPANPYRSGYIFLGWEPSVAPTVTGDARYVAQWGYIGPQYPNPTPVQPVQPGILPPQTGDMPLWYAIARFLGLVK